MIRDDQPDAREGQAGRTGVAERLVVPLKPVQPMKAASAAVLIEPMNPSAIAGAGLVIGAFFLLLGVTGIVGRIARRVAPSSASSARPVRRTQRRLHGHHQPVLRGTGGEELGRRGHSKDHRPDLHQMIAWVCLNRPVWFAHDSALEGGGFEPSVPCRRADNKSGGKTVHLGVQFALDSPLERAGFEPSVPGERTWFTQPWCLRPFSRWVPLCGCCAGRYWAMRSGARYADRAMTGPAFY